MGIWNCGGRVKGLGMFLLSFGLLSERERERDELDAVGRERHCRKEGEGILDSREIVL